ncbi:transposase family protein [Streptomyces litmocidini]|uniref:Transposase family protein n=1 Tax=Streptomyces litmocidini TaxID=67318 RepID=A0ABW7UG99_9ACTN
MLPGEEGDNAEHSRARSRVERAFARMKHYKILRDCRRRGHGLHHAVQAVAHLHNLAMTARPGRLETGPDLSGPDLLQRASAVCTRQRTDAVRTVPSPAGLP